MMEKLFGANEREQIEYLETRIIVSYGIILSSVIAAPFVGEGALAVIAIVAYVWAWSFIKRMLGTASLLTYLAGLHNVVLGIFLGMFFLILGDLVGLLYIVIGTVWYIVIKIRSLRNR